MSTDPAQVRMDTIREQAAEFDEYDARMKMPLTTPLPAVSAPTSDDVYHRAARALSAHGAYESPEVAEFYAVARAKRPAFRAAVDAAREDLAAEVARVTAERDQARARIAELEADATRKRPLMMCNGGEMVLVTDMKAYFARPTTLPAGWVGQFQQPKDGSDD